MRTRKKSDGFRVFHPSLGWGSVIREFDDRYEIAFDTSGERVVDAQDVMVQSSFLPSGERMRYARPETKKMEAARTNETWGAARLLRDIDTVVMAQIDRLGQSGFLSGEAEIREQAMKLRAVVERATAIKSIPAEPDL